MLIFDNIIMELLSATNFIEILQVKYYHWLQCYFGLLRCLLGFFHPSVLTYFDPAWPVGGSYQGHGISVCMLVTCGVEERIENRTILFYTKHPSL